MGTNVQVCWHKFARYWDVDQRLVPVEGERYALNAEEAAKACDENTIGVVGVLGSTFTGEYEPIAEISARLDDLQARTGLDVPIHVDGASGGFVAPFLQPDLVWDFRLPRVKSINASGHKYGLAPLGVGWVLWRDAADLPEELVFHVNYLGGDMPVFAINFSRPGSQVIAQYYNFVRLGPRGLPADPAERPGRGAPPGRRDRGHGPVPHPDPRHRPAGALVDHGRRRQLHGLRALGRAAQPTAGRCRRTRCPPT